MERSTPVEGTTRQLAPRAAGSQRAVPQPDGVLRESETSSGHGALLHQQSVDITAPVKDSEERHRIRSDVERDGHPPLETDDTQAGK